MQSQAADTPIKKRNPFFYSHSEEQKIVIVRSAMVQPALE
ncbi:hypothetical protein [Azospirillum palustre]